MKCSWDKVLLTEGVRTVSFSVGKRDLLDGGAARDH